MLAALDTLGVGPQPDGEAAFIQGASRECQNGLSSILFTGGNQMAIQFEKKHADNKTGPLVSIDKWVVAHDATM